MKNILFFTLMLFTILKPQVTQAQEFFVCDNAGNIGKVNMSNCSYKLIPLTKVVPYFVDITFHPNGKLYGFLSGNLYEIDTIPNSFPKIVAYKFGLESTSLTADKNGTIYGASSQLWSYSLATNQFKIHGNMLVDNVLIQAGGDLTFYNGNLYVATGNNKMVQINIEDPSKSTIVLSFPSQDTIFGIMSYVDCGKVRTFATTNSINSEVLEIDWNTFTTKSVCNVPVTIYGAASRYEFLASKPDTTFLEQYTCDSSKSKITSQTYKNSQNCDSIVTTKILYAGSNPLYETFYTCDVSKVRTSALKFINKRGCDSIIYRTGVLKNDTISTSKLICVGDSLFFGDKYLKQKGEYLYNFKRPFFCDSVVKLSLIVNPKPIKKSNFWVCEKTNVRVDTVKMNAKSACDTLLITNYQLALRTKDSITLNQTLCFGEKRNWNNQILDKTNIYKAFLKNIYGCDSSVTLNLTVKNEIRFAQKLKLCEGNSLRVGDTTLKTSGVYVNKLKNTEGCDSIVTTDLTVVEIDLTMPIDTVLKMGDSVRLIPLSQTILPIKWQWTPKDFIDCDTCPAIWAKPPVPTKYRLLIYDTLSKCEKEGFVFVNTNTDCAVFIPTAFSPNDDRVNDVLKIYLDKCIKRVKRFGLYGRWGNQIIETNFPTQDSPRELDLWDGFIEGKVASNEVYVYFVEVEYINGASKIISGDVTLIR
jgi:hypothetical protein